MVVPSHHRHHSHLGRYALAALAVVLASGGSARAGSPQTPADGPAAAGLNLAAQVGGRVTAVALTADHAYLGQGARLVVASWHPPALPERLGETRAGVEVVAGIAVQGHVAYVAGGLSGLWVADVA